MLLVANEVKTKLLKATWEGLIFRLIVVSWKYMMILAVQSFVLHA